ncbi:hypothetical protein EC844_102145 [Acinetobacter calcoaceticus]|uniref:Amidohydrolase 3 domain-containing protein n=1 Tax=Acinetobacter calcoaceticus TaxID=471 RepID=A0A4V2R1T7_ACICA|nr:hypothetical protein EC844_102145 [Acinetobacter calcoaceticus]
MQFNFKKACLVFSMGLAVSASTWAKNNVEHIYINGKIYTAVENAPLQQAIAIGSDGTIIKVGSDKEIKKLADQTTQVTDLGQKVLLPGMIDSHVHTLVSGVEGALATLDEADRDLKVLEQKLIQAQKDGTGIAGDVLFMNGLSSEYWEQNAQISKLFNSKPWKDQAIVLVGSDHHTAWANQAMLKKAGIDAAYVKALRPASQKNISHDTKFNPTGFLVDSGWDMVSEHIPALSHEVMYQGSKQAVQYYNSLGITAWMDIAANGKPLQGIFNMHNTENTLGMIPMYKELSENGDLSARVSGLHVINSKSTEQVLDVVEKINQKYSNIENFKLIGLKIFADGVIEYPAQSAALMGKYSNTQNSGQLLFDPVQFKGLVNEADKRGILIHIHAIGDRAVHESLNAIEYARSQRQSAISHSITHLQLVDPKDYPRFKQNNVIASMQLAWAYEDGMNLSLVKPYISAESYKGMYPAHSLIQHGATIAGASDAPVSTPNPFEAMAVAMTRKGPDGGYLNPAEAITLDQILKAYTINSAKALGLSAQIGSLEAGKKADMVILDRDIFKANPQQLSQTQVVTTIFNGKQVYQQSSKN